MADLIAEPGLYPDLPEDQYHADPVKGRSLSQSGAKALLDCPAKFRWGWDNPQPPKNVFDVGHAAHKLVLGSGPEIAEIKFRDYNTKAAREARDEARAEGKTPVLTKEHDTVKAMAAAIKDHPVASRLFDPETGSAEQTIVWEDFETGVRCRARFDFLRRPIDGRVIIPDYKTTISASATSFAKSVANYGYHQQDDWYTEGAKVLGLDEGGHIAFVFVAQEKTPPYVVSIFQLDATARSVGRQRNRDALHLFRHCMETSEWPAYSDDIELLSLPTWAIRNY